MSNDPTYEGWFGWFYQPIFPMNRPQWFIDSQLYCEWTRDPIEARRERIRHRRDPTQ